MKRRRRGGGGGGRGGGKEEGRRGEVGEEMGISIWLNHPGTIEGITQTKSAPVL